MYSRFKPLLLLVWFASSVSAPAANAAPLASIRARIEPQIASHPFNENAIIGLYVMDVASSQPILNHNGEDALKPASNNKLLSTGAALSLLGPDYRFITEVQHTGNFSNGTIEGDMIVKGGGDPTISGRFEKNKKDVTATMRRWAEQLAAKGVKRVTGDLVADDTFFDRDYFHSLWYDDERGEWYEAEIWGLSFNDNCIDISWSAKNKLPGEVAGMVINPPNRYATLTNDVLVSARGRSSTRWYKREDTSNDIHATGTLAVDTSKEDSASIYNGPLFFLSLFRDTLTSAGIEVAGHEKQIPVNAPSEKRTTLIRHQSPPLLDVLKVVNLNSQNFYAECVLKTLGRERLNDGSFEAGAQVIEQFYEQAGIYNEGNRVIDGSGLSGENMVSPRQLCEVLQFMDAGPYKEHWRSTLPQGRTRGSLKSRFQQSALSKEMAPKIYGKTGLIGGVRSLSGVVTNRAGREMYYSLILNGLRRASSPDEFIDAVITSLADTKE